MLSGSSSDRLCFFCRTKDKECHNNGLCTSSRRAALHMRSHTHASAPRLHIWAHVIVPPSCLYAQIAMFCSHQNLIAAFSAQVGPEMRENRGDQSHFLNELTTRLSGSGSGGSEKRTIINHYSAPNCCWQAWARQIRKWRDYKRFSLSCTLLLFSRCQV